MGLRNWLKRRKQMKFQTALQEFLGKASEDLAAEGGWSVAGSLLNTRGDSPWTTYSTSEAENLFNTMSIIFACVKKIGDTAPTIPYTVVSYDAAGERVERADHPYLKVFERPNQAMSYSEFLYNVVTHLELTAESYIWKTRNRAGFVDGLWPFPTSWITMEVDRQGIRSHYLVQRGDYRQEIPLDDMIYIHYPDPANPYASAGPTQACIRDTQIDEARAEYLIELLNNMHIPGPILTQKTGWTEPQMAQVRRLLRDKIGKGKRGSPLFIGGEGVSADYKNPLADLDWPGTAGLAETRICSTFEVPPILIHLRSGLERATYSNYETAKKTFYSGKMTSVSQKVADGFSLGLLHAEGEEEFWLEPVFDDVAEMQEDQDSIHERARADWQVGGLTLDEFLEKIGTEVVGGEAGKVRVRPANLVEFTPGEEPDIPDTMPEDEDVEDVEDNEPAPEDEIDTEETVEDEEVEDGEGK